MDLNYQAIRRVHTQVVKYDGGIAYDREGNVVELDVEAIETETAVVETENDWLFLRQDRNRLLAQTDWAALSDVSMTDDMRTYRQALRDLPANTTDPTNPVWPEKPAS